MCYGSIQHNYYSSTRASFIKKLEELLIYMRTLNR